MVSRTYQPWHLVLAVPEEYEASLRPAWPYSGASLSRRPEWPELYCWANEIVISDLATPKVVAKFWSMYWKSLALPAAVAMAVTLSDKTRVYTGASPPLQAQHMVALEKSASSYA
eukprot:scaffold87363_cov42-Phaeocystis_antarctica.AAC.1